MALRIVVTISRMTKTLQLLVKALIVVTFFVVVDAVITFIQQRYVEAVHAWIAAGVLSCCIVLLIAYLRNNKE